MNTSSQSNETRLQEAHTLVQRYIQSIIERDVESWMSLWDDNFVLEFPFAPQGRPPRIENKAALYPYIQTVINDLEILNISRQEIYLTQDPDLIIAEIAGEGRITSTGRNYKAGYVWIMRTKNGKLIHMRDYWNPLAALEARGGLDTTNKS
jgi:ketosteroid isomerase-like protein